MSGASVGRGVVRVGLCVALSLFMVACGAKEPASSPPLTPTAPASTTAPTTTVPPPRAKPGTLAAVPVKKLHIGSLPLSGGPVHLSAISCWSRSNCVVVGSYADNNNAILYDSTAFYASEIRGKWQKAKLVPGVSQLPGFDPSGDQTSLTWIHCAQGGKCFAGGIYSTSDVLDNQLFVVDVVDGKWDRAVPVPGLNHLNRGAEAGFAHVWCNSAGTCEAVGTYADANVNLHKFSVREVNGVWQEAHQLR